MGWHSLTGGNAYVALARVRARLVAKKREQGPNYATMANTSCTTTDRPKFPSQQWRNRLADSMELFYGSREDVWLRSMVYALRHERDDEMVGRQIEEGVERMLGIINDQHRRLSERAK